MKVALRKRNGILEFLGFVDGKGRIRKAKANPMPRLGYVARVEATSGNTLLGGVKVHTSSFQDNKSDALKLLRVFVEQNRLAGRKMKSAKVVQAKLR